MRIPLLLMMFSLAACSSSLNPDSFPLTIPDGRICSDVHEPPLIEDTSHVESEFAFNHNTDPPTSGRHFGRWSEPGVFPAEVPDGALVHSLEHGYVVVHYRDATEEQVSAMTDAVAADQAGVILAPRPSSPFAFTLTSWGRAQVCSEVPVDAAELIRDFVDAYRGSDRAPEGSLATR